MSIERGDIDITVDDPYGYGKSFDVASEVTEDLPESETEADRSKIIENIRFTNGDGRQPGRAQRIVINEIQKVVAECCERAAVPFPVGSFFEFAEFIQAGAGAFVPVAPPTPVSIPPVSPLDRAAPSGAIAGWIGAIAFFLLSLGDRVFPDSSFFRDLNQNRSRKRANDCCSEIAEAASRVRQRINTIFAQDAIRTDDSAKRYRRKKGSRKN